MHITKAVGYREYASQLFEFIQVKQSIKKHRSKGNGQEEHQEKRE